MLRPRIIWLSLVFTWWMLACAAAPRTTQQRVTSGQQTTTTTTTTLATAHRPAVLPSTTVIADPNEATAVLAALGQGAFRWEISSPCGPIAGVFVGPESEELMKLQWRFLRTTDPNCPTGVTEIPFPGLAVRESFMLDIDGDQRLELIALVDPVPETGMTLHHPLSQTTIRIFDSDLDRGGAHLSVGRSLDYEAQLLGVTDRASLESQMSTLNHFEPPTEQTPLPRLLARLAYASPEEFRALLPRQGLRICANRRCTQRALTALRLDGENPTLQLATTFRFARYQVHDGLSDPICGSSRTGEYCSANGMQPVALRFDFTGRGTARRLSTITHGDDLSR